MVPAARGDMLIVCFSKVGITGTNVILQSGFFYWCFADDDTTSMHLCMLFQAYVVHAWWLLNGQTLEIGSVPGSSVSLVLEH